MTRRGVDISSHQGNINLASLKNQVDFVIIRVGYGLGHEDSRFERNTKECIKLGIPFGFYWYSYALSIETAIKEAEYFTNFIRPYKDSYSYGAWLDMEDADNWKRNHGMPNNETLRNICKNFCDVLESNGFYTGIYASRSWFDNQLNGPEIKSFDKWLAQWPTSGGAQIGLNTDPNKISGYNLWQFTSVGRFSGYDGSLDTNYSYIDYPAIIRGDAPAVVSPEGSTLELVYRTMKDEFGKGEARKENLGDRYDEVQDMINHIYSAPVKVLVDEVYARKYGDGELRRVVLGDRYDEVQDAINNAKNDRVYIVKSGDTLSKIASELGTTYQELARINGIENPNKIYPGQEIRY